MSGLFQINSIPVYDPMQNGNGMDASDNEDDNEANGQFDDVDE